MQLLGGISGTLMSWNNFVPGNLTLPDLARQDILSGLEWTSWQDLFQDNLSVFPHLQSTDDGGTVLIPSGRQVAKQERI